MTNTEAHPRRHLRRHAGPLFFLAAVVLLCYAPVLFSTYAFLDDYAAFVDTRSWPGAKMLMSAMVTDGRPVYGVIVAAAFGWTNGIADFAFIRGWTVAWIVVTALAIAHLLRCRGYDGWLAGSFATSWALLPSIQVFVSWAQVGVGQAPAVFIAFVAAGLLDPASGEVPRRRRIAARRPGPITHRLHSPVRGDDVLGVRDAAAARLARCQKGAGWRQGIVSPRSGDWDCRDGRRVLGRQGRSLVRILILGTGGAPG